MLENLTNTLLNWYDENRRDLPWRHTKDPYKIWLSEIIMQQTQIVQGTSYYLKFIEKFPTVFHLASAEEQEVLVLWQGLGYYSRARNLHKTAKDIVSIYQGKFPKTYTELIKFKGIGDYTASAIASICFNASIGAIDGNVLRVISRMYAIDDPINKAKGKKEVKKVIKKLVSNKRPGDFNQAIMDFGSQQCKSNNPDCINCILNSDCIAYEKGITHLLPLKEKAPKKMQEHFYYFVLYNSLDRDVIIRRRESGIWSNLYEFPKIVSDEEKSDMELIETFSDLFSIKQKIIIQKSSPVIKHILSHKKLFIKFFTLSLFNENSLFHDNEKFLKVKIQEISKFPFPVIIKKFIEQNFMDI